MSDHTDAKIDPPRDPRNGEPGRPAQPSPPRHTTTAPADPDREPNPGDPGFPLLEPRVPEQHAGDLPDAGEGEP